MRNVAKTAGFAVILACGISFSASPALAQLDLIKGALGVLGITTDEKDPIDYRERAPLVVPPKQGGPKQGGPNLPVTGGVPLGAVGLLVLMLLAVRRRRLR